MPSESGDMKLLGNFNKLIELVSIDANYNPANAKLKVAALTAQNTAAVAATTDVRAKDAPYKVAVNDRQSEFEELRPVVPRIGNMLQASGADQRTRDDAKTLTRKIVGEKKAAKAKDGPDAPTDGATKTHSASQQSYENITGNFEALIALLETVDSYAPNEPDLTIAGLKARATGLKAKSEAVNSTFAPLSAARGLRDQLLYTNEDSVVNIALLVKAYVRAAFGANSQLFKQIKGLQFTRPKK